MPSSTLVTHLHCPRCGIDIEPTVGTYVCPKCGSNLLVDYDFEAASRVLNRDALASNPDRTIWRYLPVLPVTAALEGPPVGGTSLVEAKKLATALGVAKLLIKDDGKNPSASFKDRASAVAIQHARESGFDMVTGASTGNAASATAVLSAQVGMKARIFVPKAAPRAKIAQLVTFGAEVLAVDGTYDQAFDLCLEATRRWGWYNRNTGFNPYTREGKKTVSFEIVEALGFEVPDLVVVPVGDGNIFSGVWKGFVEAKKLGLIDRLPKMLAAQAEGSAAIVNAFHGDGIIRAVSGDTVADSISVSVPRDGDIAVRSLRESEGIGVTVSDDEILAAIPALARASGIFGEPAAATGLAALQKASREGLLDPTWTVVMLNTGNGLKDINAAITAASKVAAEPRVIPADLACLEGLFG
jgi:threonine synthase